MHQATARAEPLQHRKSLTSQASCRCCISTLPLRPELHPALTGSPLTPQWNSTHGQFVPVSHNLKQLKCHFQRSKWKNDADLQGDVRFSWLIKQVTINWFSNSTTHLKCISSDTMYELQNCFSVQCSGKYPESNVSLWISHFPAFCN